MAKTIKAVLFDRDNTLAQTDVAVYAQAGQWLAQHFGQDASHAQRTLVALWQERGPLWAKITSHAEETAYWNDYGTQLATRLQLPPGAIEAFMEHYPYERYLRAVPHAREVLSELRKQGHKIGVLSNTFPSIERTLEAIKVADLVDVPLATCLMGAHKPEPLAFVQAAEALGFAPKEILFIDDKPENIEAARQLGMKAELIDLTGKTPQAISTLTEVLKLVES